MEIIINNGTSKFKNLELVAQFDVTDAVRFTNIAYNFEVGAKYLVHGYCTASHRVVIMNANTASSSDVYQKVYDYKTKYQEKQFTVEQTENTGTTLQPKFIQMFLINNPSTSYRKALKVFKIVEE